MRLELRRVEFQRFAPRSRPVVVEGLVVGFLHELVDADEVEEAVRAARRGHVGREERVVHRGQPLLAVEDDVLGRRASLDP